MSTRAFEPEIAQEIGNTRPASPHAGKLPPVSEALVSSEPASHTTPQDGPPTAVHGVGALPPIGLPAQLFGTYELEEVIGEGGMGVVFRARDLTLGREVALKMLRTGLRGEPREVQRFYHEARSAAKLEHPHIVPIFEVNQQQGRPYYTMRLMSGGSLSKMRERLRGDARGVAFLMEKVARAVQFAHEKGVLHRDLKPGNILIDEQGEPQVADFGLAKVLGLNLDLTDPGSPVGTPVYMAPEQAAGKNHEITPASDVWSLGVVLYELLTGTRPFDGKTRDEIMSRIQVDEPTPPGRLEAKLPRDLQTVCLKCLQKKPGRRYGSAGDLADDLHRWLVGEPILARPPSWPQRLWRKVKKHRVLVGGVLLALVVTAAVIIYDRQTDPDRVAKSYLKRLAKGEAVTLVGDTGLPAWSRWATRTPGTARLIERDGLVLQVEAGDLGLLELLPSPPARSYRLRAEMQQLSGEPGGQAAGHHGKVGLYFFHEGFNGERGLLHHFCYLIYSDMEKVRWNDEDPPRARAGVSICRHREENVGPWNPHDPYDFGMNLYFSPQPPTAEEPANWRRLSVEVRPDAVTAAWDDQRVPGKLASGHLRQFIEHFRQDPAYAGDDIPDFRFGGGMGVYVFGAGVAVRRVVIEPISDK